MPTSPVPAPVPALRFGVEEEFLLVDAATGTSAPRAGQVLVDASQVLGDRAQSEFYTTQVEGCTPPVRAATALYGELTGMRRAMAAAASRAGCLLVASGSAVLPSVHPLPVTDTGRYRRIAALLGPVADQVGGEICGCHVHIGDLTRSEALAVANRLRPWLSVLQALGANSPFCEGRDSGLASSRVVHYSGWPTFGPPPVLTESGYERLVDRLVASGVILDRRMVYWFARPSEHLPTLEVRIADVNADIDVTVLLAVLVRGLTQVFLTEARSGAGCPRVAQAALHAAHRRAALAGLRGTGLDPVTGEPAAMPRLLARLLDRAAPGLEAAGDLSRAHALTAHVLRNGTGADRQRSALTHHTTLRGVVDHLADLTTTGPTPQPDPPPPGAAVAA
ncbi:carboxylate-amine ligase [Kitasatospora sp. MAA4]|uniref:carboxylate-amine ligase n=1 Tax=Kitasatospora sp. MAA4 TaxID=3035093 RepID=UPI0024749D1E|nr:glutamate--cysteine ligase [Kitasatospora sp. MAA4]MDH6137829.1 carboxylate-amine ligase [Kitasatospora sp. MAA4]